MNDAPIGVYDSGLGGLTVWREVRRMLPSESLVYLGDGKNCPYGSRPREEVRRLADEAVASLVAQGCKMVVVACNTATAAAIDFLREKYAPKVRGIVSGEEAKAIYEVLEIDKRNNIELQNIRDMVVMIYGQWFDKSRDQYLEDKKNGVQAVDKSAEYLDAMSAIICVIDYEKFKRGIGV